MFKTGGMQEQHVIAVCTLQLHLTHQGVNTHDRGPRKCLHLVENTRTTCATRCWGPCKALRRLVVCGGLMVGLLVRRSAESVHVPGVRQGVVLESQSQTACRGQARLPARGRVYCSRNSLMTHIYTYHKPKPSDHLHHHSFQDIMYNPDIKPQNCNPCTKEPQQAGVNSKYTLSKHARNKSNILNTLTAADVRHYYSSRLKSVHDSCRIIEQAADFDIHGDQKDLSSLVTDLNFTSSVRHSSIFFSAEGCQPVKFLRVLSHHLCPVHYPSIYTTRREYASQL
ncbi:hypothetical protein J6590_051477 [Homalodisca vitripennis]|nr:hypothetical protein J6590_051477 [Homalodisca vitripennis]